jgi:hypothetical protein
MQTTHLNTLRLGFAFTWLLATATARAQSLEIPQTEFNLSFSKAVIELSPGESGQLDILILKSKGYAKSKVKMGISSTLPTGVAISFDPDKGNFDSTRASIRVDADAHLGQHMVILNATVNNKTKGSIFGLLIK